MTIEANIMTKLSGSDLSDDVGGRIFEEIAPNGCEYPYVVFSIDDGPPEYTFVTASYEDRSIQFSLYSISEGLTEITTMYAHLKTLFDECTMTITGETLIWMRRQNKTEIIEQITTPAGTAMLRFWAVDYNLVSRIAA